VRERLQSRSVHEEVSKHERRVDFFFAHASAVLIRGELRGLREERRLGVRAFARGGVDDIVRGFFERLRG
jgi:hypothetical protein